MAERVETRPRVVLALLAVTTLGTTVLTGCSEPPSGTSRVFPLNEVDLNPPTEAELGRQALELFTKPRTRGVGFAKWGREQVTERARFYRAEAGGREFQLNRGYLVLGDGRTYGLGTVGGIIRAHVWVEANLMKIFPEAAGWWGRLPKTAFYDIEWVLQRVSISPLSTNSISPLDLVDLARGIRILELAGKEIPASMAINPTKRPPGGTLIFRGEPHRNLAAFILEKNPDLLDNYKKGVDEALASISQPLLRPDLSSVSDYGYLTYQDSPKQEFLTTLGYFLQNAEDITRRIEAAKKAGFLEEAAVLQVKLEVIQRWLEKPAKDPASLGMSLPQNPNESFHPGCSACEGYTGSAS